jgi:hypothetical protein
VDSDSKVPGDMLLVYECTRPANHVHRSGIYYSPWHKRQVHANQLYFYSLHELVSILGHMNVYSTSGRDLRRYETAETLGTSYRPTAYRWPDNMYSSYDKDYIRRRLAGFSGASE